MNKILFIKKFTFSPLISFSVVTIIGHLFSLFVLTISTKVIDLDVFGIVAVFTSVLVVLSPISCLRIEQRLLVCKNKEIPALVIQSLKMGLIFISFIVILAWVFKYLYPSFLGNQNHDIFILFSFLCFCLIPSQVYTILITRFLKTHLLVYLNIIRILSQQASILFLIAINNSEIALLVGEFFFFFIPCVIALFNMKKVFLIPVKYYAYSVAFNNELNKDLLATILNAINGSIPIWIVSGTYGYEIGGLFSVALRVAHIPIGVFGRAVTTQFNGEFSQKIRGLEKKCALRIFNKYLLLLAVISLVTYSLIFFVSDNLVLVLFGEKWIRSQVFLNLFIPFVALKFIYSPLSSGFFLLGRITTKLYIDLLLMFLLACIAAISFFVTEDTDLVIICLAWTLSLIYMLSLGSLANIVFTHILLKKES